MDEAGVLGHATLYLVHSPQGQKQTDCTSVIARIWVRVLHSCIVAVWIRESEEIGVSESVPKGLSPRVSDRFL